MKAKEWRRRINRASQAASAGNVSLIQELCNELESLTEPKPEPMPEPVSELQAVSVSEIET